MRRKWLVPSVIVAAACGGAVLVAGVYMMRSDWASDVRPADLTQLIGAADRVVVREGPWKGSPILYQSTGAKDVADLQHAVKVGRPEGFVHCMCDGTPAVFLYANGKEIGRFTNHPASLLRSSLWKSDATIENPEAFLRWFDARGVKGPRAEYDEASRSAAEYEAAHRKWDDAMPVAVKPFWPGLRYAWDPDVGPADRALTASVPDRRERMLALLRWYGSGKGPWSGYPMYEGVPAQMLAEYDTAEILEAARSHELTPAETEGVARLFCMSDSARPRRGDLPHLPADFKRLLLEHSLNHSAEDNREIARRWFGDSSPPP